MAGFLPTDHAILLACDDIDLTDHGARLDVGVSAAHLDCPFDFFFDNFRTIRPAKLALRLGSIVGIQFVKQ